MTAFRRRVAALAAAMLSTPVTAQTQAEMNIQAGTDDRAADAAMNVQYRATMVHMKRMDGYAAPDHLVGPTYQAVLLASQRAWLVFRDAECVVEGYQFRGGSAQGMAGSQCLARLTRSRTGQLRQMTMQK